MRFSQAYKFSYDEHAPNWNLLFNYTSNNLKSYEY